MPLLVLLVLLQWRLLLLLMMVQRLLLLQQLSLLEIGCVAGTGVDESVDADTHARGDVETEFQSDRYCYCLVLCALETRKNSYSQS